VCLQQDFRPWMLLKNYTLTAALFHPSDLPIQGSWSLTVEECFYALAPIFMLLTRRRGFMATLLLGTALLAAALAVAELPTEFLHTRGFVFSTTFFGHFLEFFAGVYLALAVLRLEAQGPIARPGNRYTVAGLAGVLLVIIAMMITYGHQPLHMGVITLLNNFLIPLPIAVLYRGLLQERTWLSRALSGRLAGLLGRGSYAFYLMHMLIVHYVGIPLLLPLVTSRLVCVALTFSIAWVASVLLFMYFEEPVNLYIRRIGGTKGQRVPRPLRPRA
jgi:peptidoglycan/LPS O-acetylase OafA/YrhL